MTDSTLTEEELTQKHKKERKDLQGTRIRNQISYHLQSNFLQSFFFCFFLMNLCDFSNFPI